MRLFVDSDLDNAVTLVCAASDCGRAGDGGSCCSVEFLSVDFLRSSALPSATIALASRACGDKVSGSWSSVARFGCREGVGFALLSAALLPITIAPASLACGGRVSSGVETEWWYSLFAPWIDWRGWRKSLFFACFASTSSIAADNYSLVA